MNLDELKPAWHQYKLQNSLESVDHQAILQIIGLPDQEADGRRFIRLAANVTMFLILFICCQGG